MKLILLGEGATEMNCLPAFFKRWLDPLLPRPISIKVDAFDGWPNVFQEIPFRARRHLQNPEVIAVVSLLDFNGPMRWPASKRSANQRRAWGKASIESQVKDKRFRHFFAMHEIEAWLLADPQIFPTNILDEVKRKSSNPESVNLNEPPSKLLKRLYHKSMSREYSKPIDGAKLFEKLDPEIARGKCPGLRELLDEMLRLAKAAQM